MPSEQFDVVVIGSGASGLFSALAAQSMGLSCIVLEKAAKLGGGTAISAGMLWIGANHLASAAGEQDSQREAEQYLEFVGADGLDPERMRRFVAEAPGALRFFEKLGLPFRLTNAVDHYHGVAPGGKRRGRIVELPPISGKELGAHENAVATPAGPLYRLGAGKVQKLGGPSSPRAWQAADAASKETPDMRGSGMGLVSWLVKRASERGVVLRNSAPVEQLLVENGSVSGVVVAGGQRIDARRGVVIASGGYESNPELVRIYEGLPGWQSMFPETLSGDGLLMAQEHGAAIDSISNNLSIFLGFRNPDENPDGIATCRLSAIQELIAPHTIVVNREGLRFADETFFQAVAPVLRHFDPKRRTMPNLPCFLIFDSQYGAKQSFAGRAPGAAIPDWVPRDETLKGLAGKLGIDAAGLVQTVERFNADAQAGSDSAFHRGETSWGQSSFSARETLGSIAKPPFFGIELHPSALASAGLRTDLDTRVIDVRGRPIPGLHAVGNATARKETGSGYQTGFSLGSAMTFGLVAARNLAGKNRENKDEGG